MAKGNKNLGKVKIKALLASSVTNLRYWGAPFACYRGVYSSTLHIIAELLAVLFGSSFCSLHPPLPLAGMEWYPLTAVSV